MYRARNCLTENSLRKLYFAYIYPYLIYCIEIWGISPQTHLKPLFLLQKKLVRIMTFSTYYAHTDPLFKDMEILIIDKIVIHRIGILMYKLNSGHLPKVLCNFFKKIMKFIITTLEQKICFAFHMNLKLSPLLVQKFGMHLV